MQGADLSIFSRHRLSSNIPQFTRSFLLLFSAQIKCVNRPFLHANEKRIAGTTYTPDATLGI